MGICILGLGDCGSKTDTSSVANKTLINQTLTNMITKTSQTATTTIKANQTGSIHYKGGVDMDNCPNALSIYQSLKVNSDIKLVLNTKSGSDLKTQIANALSALQTSDTKQKQGALTTANVSSSTHTTTNDVINNLVSTNVWNETAQTLNNTIKAFQTGKIDIDGPFKCKNSANASQIVQEAIVSQLVGIMMDALYSTQVDTELKNTDDTKQVIKTTQDNSGLGGLIQGIMDTLAKLVGGAMGGAFLLMMCPCIVLICCAFAICGHGGGGGGKSSSSPSNISVPSAPSVPVITPAAAAFGKRLRKQLKSLKKY